MRFEAIKDLVDTLPESERQKLITYLTGSPKAAPAQDSYDDDWLLDAIVLVLKERGLGPSIPPRSRIPHLQDYEIYNKRAHHVRSWLKVMSKLTAPTELRSLALISCRQLAHYVSGFTEVNIRTMLRNAHQIPEALDRGFPGYARAGVLEKLVRKRNG